jgi:hypothetical protein
MTSEKKELILVCPHCKEPVIIEEINCGIFRHGIFKNGTHIDPHSSKEQCDLYIREQLIYGCGLPFQIVETNNGTFKLIICDYI